MTADEADRVGRFLRLLTQATRMTGVVLECLDPYLAVKAADSKKAGADWAGQLGRRYDSNGKFIEYTMRETS